MTLDEKEGQQLLRSTYVAELDHREQDMLAMILDHGSWQDVACSLGLDASRIHWFRDIRLDHVQGSVTKHLFLTIGQTSTLQQLNKAFIDNKIQRAVDKIREFLPDIANRKCIRQLGVNANALLPASSLTTVPSTESENKICAASGAFMAHFPSDMTALSPQQILPGQNIGEGGGRAKTSTTGKTATKEQDTIMHTSSNPIPDTLVSKHSRRIFFTFAIDSKQHLDTLGKLSQYLSTQTTTRFRCSFDSTNSSPEFITDLNRRYNASDVVVVVISAQYVHELKGHNHPEYPMNAQLISQWMRADRQSRRRFVCIYFDRLVRLQDSSMKDVHALIPNWLRHQPQYLYPEQARDLFFYLSDPADNVERFLQHY